MAGSAPPPDPIMGWQGGHLSHRHPDSMRQPNYVQMYGAARRMTTRGRGISVPVSAAVAVVAAATVIATIPVGAAAAVAVGTAVGASQPVSEGCTRGQADP